MKRRDFLLSAGLIGLSVGGMQIISAQGTTGKPHFTPKAKRVIFLNMRGAPSHVDTFDYKPVLNKQNGKTGKYGRPLLGSPWKFNASGKSGLYISEVFPEIGKMADELTLMRGMFHDQPNHPQAQTVMHTGNAQFTRPALGSWLMYGLGSDNKDIPGFISLSPVSGTSSHYSSAFLPSRYQGTAIGSASFGNFGSGEQKMADLENKFVSRELQRKQIDFMQILNKEQLVNDKFSPESEGVMESLELAYRMQESMPKVMDTTKESAATKKMYGLENRQTAVFGQQCLLARKFIENGARFVELTHQNWDHHFNMKVNLPQKATEIDLPIAGLLQDLKQRGLLKETLVIWAGEFGRTPEGQGLDGRNHNNKGFCVWMAGGGVKRGFSYGSTDDLGYEAVDGRMSMHDWHATIMYLMGLDHEKLTYNFAGRDFRATDVYGNIAKEIMQ